MKEMCRTGVFKFGGINTKSFELSSVRRVSSMDSQKLKSRRPKKSGSSKNRGKKNPKRMTFKKKGTSSSLTSQQALDLIRFPTESNSSGKKS